MTKAICTSNILSRQSRKWQNTKLEDKKPKDQSFSQELLQTLGFTMKTKLEVEEHQGKINDQNKQVILDQRNKNINQLDKNQTTEKKEYMQQTEKKTEKV